MSIFHRSLPTTSLSAIQRSHRADEVRQLRQRSFWIGAIVILSAVEGSLAASGLRDSLRTFVRYPDSLPQRGCFFVRLEARAPFGGCACNPDADEGSADFPADRPTAESESASWRAPHEFISGESPCKDRSCCVQPAPSRSRRRDKFVRSKAVGRSCPPASATSPPRRSRSAVSRLQRHASRSVLFSSTRFVVRVTVRVSSTENG